MISAGSNATIVDIPIINDTTVEENETFNISLNVLPNTGVALAAPSTAIVVIIDTGTHVHSMHICSYCMI